MTEEKRFFLANLYQRFGNGYPIAVLRRKEAAQVLRCSPSTVDNLCIKKKLQKTATGLIQVKSLADYACGRS